MHKALAPIRRFLLLALLLLPSVTLATEAPPAPPTPAPPVAPAPPVSPGEKEGGAPPAELSVRIGYVDMTRLGGESIAGKAARAQLKEKNDSLRERVTARQKQLDKQKIAIEEKLPTLSPK